MPATKCIACGRLVDDSTAACHYHETKSRGSFWIWGLGGLLLGAGIYTNIAPQRDDPLAVAESWPTISSSTPSSAAVDSAATKKWHFQTSTSPLDGSVTSTLKLAPVSGSSSWGKPFSLAVRCQAQTTELFVKWHDYLGNDFRDVSEEGKWVIIRVGSAPARRERWSISTDKQSTFSNTAVATLREIASADTLLLETTTYDKNLVTARYDTRGLAEPLSRIASDCQWAM